MGSGPIRADESDLGSQKSRRSFPGAMWEFRIREKPPFTWDFAFQNAISLLCGNLTFTLENLHPEKVGFHWFSMCPSFGGPNARISASKTHTICARLAQGEDPLAAARVPARPLDPPGSTAPLGRRGVPLGKSGFPRVPRA